MKKCFRCSAKNCVNSPELSMEERSAILNPDSNSEILVLIGRMPCEDYKKILLGVEQR